MMFLVLTFAASWSLWTLSAVVMGGDFAHPSRLAALGGAIYLLGVFAPALAAIAVTAHRHGADAVKELVGRTVAWDVSPWFYAVAILFSPVLRLAAAAIQRAAVGSWPSFGTESVVVMIAGTIVSTPAQAGEEIGWRGFLLPGLSKRVGVRAASVIVGVIWAAWHLPFFFIAGTDKWGQSFPAYLGGLTAMSVAMAWLYWRTHGSLLLTMLMHSALNNIRPVAAPPADGGSALGLHAPFIIWATVGVLWIAAAGLLIAMRGARGAFTDNVRSGNSRFANG